ncbi:MAG: FAD-dependent oxidoreductase, partial [Acidimicrobiia bacterium]
RVVGIRHVDDRAVAVVAEAPDGTRTEHPCDQVISSMPISQLLQVMDPPPPAEVLAAASSLQYRDFLTVALVVPAEKVAWNDNWIYIHAPEVKTMRIQNFGSWSPYLVKEGRTCLGLEFFVNEGDAMWTKSDEDLVEQAKRELQQLGLADSSKVEAGYVVRMPKAYPVYDEYYKDNVAMMRDWVAANVPNVMPTGRNGMHKYNNQDHSMMTAILSVDNIFGGHHDVWSVNVEEEYHEEAPANAGSATGEGGTGRDAPVLPRAAIDAAADRRRQGAT